MIGWYAGLPPPRRGCVALFFLLIATLAWLLTDSVCVSCWGVGIVLLVFAFPTRGERKGFHDF